MCMEDCATVASELTITDYEAACIPQATPGPYLIPPLNKNL